MAQHSWSHFCIQASAINPSLSSPALNPKLCVTFLHTRPHGGPVGGPSWQTHYFPNHMADLSWLPCLVSILIQSLRHDPISDSSHRGSHLPVLCTVNTFSAAIVTLGRCGPVMQGEPPSCFCAGTVMGTTSQLHTGAVNSSPPAPPPHYVRQHH